MHIIRSTNIWGGSWHSAAGVTLCQSLHQKLIVVPVLPIMTRVAYSHFLHKKVFAIDLELILCSVLPASHMQAKSLFYHPWQSVHRATVTLLLHIIYYISKPCSDAVGSSLTSTDGLEACSHCRETSQWGEFCLSRQNFLKPATNVRGGGWVFYRDLKQEWVMALSMSM